MWRGRMKKDYMQADALFALGMGSETFFKLRAAGYRGDLGKRSRGRDSGPWRMVWNITGLVCKGYQR